MAILGYNTQGASNWGETAGRKSSSKFTLAASGQQITELHAWILAGGVGNSYVIHCYADSSGSPGALVAYTGLLGPYTSGLFEISQTGLAVPLAAGDYWLGVTFQGNGSGGGAMRYDGSGTHKAILSGAAVSPPSNPYGTTNNSGTNKYSVWAVYGPAATAPVANFTGTPLTGIYPLSVAFTDSSTNSPTSWAWTFGDGGTSTAQNPSHSYAAPGTYTVALTATNAAGSDVKTRTGYVVVSPKTGLFSKIKLGTGLKGTDLGGGVIQIDLA